MKGLTPMPDLDPLPARLRRRADVAASPESATLLEEAAEAAEERDHLRADLEEAEALLMQSDRLVSDALAAIGLSPVRPPGWLGRFELLAAEAARLKAEVERLKRERADVAASPEAGDLFNEA